MNCPRCDAENPASNRFCDSCGFRLLEKKDKKKANRPLPAIPVTVSSELPTISSGNGKVLPHWLQTENLLWLLIFAAAAFVRFYNLGEKPLHHDESMHAFYSWELFKGLGYQYNPMMHGPFLYHANALMYFLFGASNYTCRIMPGIAGMIMVFTAYWLRPHLGRIGALFTGAMIALSPGFVYFARFIREDIYMASATIVMVYGLFQYLATRKPKFLYIGAGALAVSFSTKEATYITGWIFTSFLAFRWLWEYTTQHPNENRLLLALRTIWEERKPFWISTGIFFGFIFLLYTTFFTHLPGFIHAFTKSLSYWLGQHEVQRGSQPVYYYVGLLLMYEWMAVLGLVGAIIYYCFIKLKENRAWRLLAFMILGLAWWLFTTQGTETFGLVFSILLISLGTGLLAFFSFGEQNLFVVFLIVYSLAAFSDYSFAGERMPWLILHLLLPMILLTGVFLGELWERFARQRAWILAGFLIMAGMLLHGTALVCFYGSGANPREPYIYVQSSKDVTQVVRQLKNMSQRLTGGLDMKITVEDYCSWPFAWYLREFKYVGYPKYSASQTEGTIEKNPVIISGVEMAAPGHDDRVAQLLAQDYIAQRYKLRVWWAPDNQAFWKDTLAGKFSKAWKLFIYREPWNDLGSYDMIVYIRKDVAQLYWSHAE